MTSPATPRRRGTGTDDFSVNTQSTAAHVTSATPSIWQINKLTLADAQPRFSVTVDYDQPMDPAYPPSITFSPNNISNLLDLPEPLATPGTTTAPSTLSGSTWQAPARWSCQASVST